MKLKELNPVPESENLSSFIRPSKFSKLIQAVRLPAEEERLSGMPDYKTPSLALKFGISLKKCGQLKRDSYLEDEDLAGAELMNNFINLFNQQWRSRVSAPALRSLRISKSKRPELLPLTSDLLKISKFINDLTNKLQQEVIDEPSTTNWARLAKATLCRIIMFNRRRSGEASRMLLSDYQNEKGQNHESSEERRNSLSNFEQKMLKYMRSLTVVGKRFRPVTVLLTPQTMKSINVLLSTRKTVGVSEKNPYVFALVNHGSENYIRGSDAVREITQLASVKCPERITSTKLRKHVATVTQIANFSENEADGLAKYLGHDIRVHRYFYRVQEDVFVSAKVAKLLLAMDKGRADKLKGKTLDQVELFGKPNYVSIGR